ncbi:UNVERIFIED_CONTAM: hypothetical protein FKN15_077186 [Acipenser sinensis]
MPQEHMDCTVFISVSFQNSLPPVQSMYRLFPPALCEEYVPQASKTGRNTN